MKSSPPDAGATEKVTERAIREQNMLTTSLGKSLMDGATLQGKAQNRMDPKMAEANVALSEPESFVFSSPPALQSSLGPPKSACETWVAYAI